MLTRTDGKCLMENAILTILSALDTVELHYFLIKYKKVAHYYKYVYLCLL